MSTIVGATSVGPTLLEPAPEVAQGSIRIGAVAVEEAVDQSLHPITQRRERHGDDHGGQQAPPRSKARAEPRATTAA